MLAQIDFAAEGQTHHGGRRCCLNGFTGHSGFDGGDHLFARGFVETDPGPLADKGDRNCIDLDSSLRRHLKEQGFQLRMIPNLVVMYFQSLPVSFLKFGQEQMFFCAYRAAVTPEKMNIDRG